MKYKTILVSFANKEHDIPVLIEALDVADVYGATVVVLHLNSNHAGYPSRVMRSFEHKYSEEEIKQLVDENQKGSAPVEIRVVQSDNLIETVVEESKAVDLLVLGHQHMGFFESLLSDSVDEKIVDKIDCDALVVKRN